MKTLLVLIFSVLLFLPAYADNSPDPAPGEVQAGTPLITGAYCKDEESAKRLSAEVARGGNVGYVRFIQADGNLCYDDRYVSGVNRIRVILTEKVWVVHHAAGELYEFWTAADASGDLGYIWFRVSPVKLPGKET